jgi:hypothetical protein
LGWTFHPTIDLLFQISTTSHPELGLGIHKKRVSLTVHSQLRYPTTHWHSPTTILISTSSLPLDLPNPRNVPLHYSQSIGHHHSFIWVSLAQVTGNLTTGNSKELTARKNYQENNNNHLLLQCNSHKSSLFRPDNLALQYLAPKKMLQNSPSIVAPAPVLFFPYVLCLLFMQKHACKNFPLWPYEFLFSPKPVDCSLYPMLIVLQPHAPNNYGM